MYSKPVIYYVLTYLKYNGQLLQATSLKLHNIKLYFVLNASQNILMWLFILFLRAPYPNGILLLRLRCPSVCHQTGSHTTNWGSHTTDMIFFSVNGHFVLSIYGPSGKKFYT
ncbi:hypothetical protein FWK35_00026059 [Aphis craccivora]|uniref:Uncharacterized protein n=1 Tax=Aphis craccivora TaxID=307492 RepID=A0A6G0VXC4_APHCR|nr:hypothetical protein FWK35_00026059 [Aphis craccivora]